MKTTARQNCVKKASELFLQNYDFIKKTIRYQTRDQHLAEDIFQNFFLSITENPIPEALKSVQAYLSRSLRNDIIDAARKKQAFRKHIVKYYEKNSDRFHKRQNPQDPIIKKETMDVIFSVARENLPLCQYKAIKFRYIQGLDIGETAKKMNVNKRTVSRYVSVGLKKLNEKLPLNSPEYNECA